jgi:hypothetical protein
MTLIQFCFPIIYQESKAVMNIYCILSVLNELYVEYAQEYNSSVVEHNLQINAIESSSSRSINVIGKKNVLTSGRDLYDSFIRNVDTLQQPIKFDLQSYLEENVLIIENGVEFNALDWWKANTLKYRILSMMASDILSISNTTVTSESTFSTGGRVIDPHRSKLSTETVQMLLCGVDWVRTLHVIRKHNVSFYFGVIVIVIVLCIYKVLNISYFLFFNLRRRRMWRKRTWRLFTSNSVAIYFCLCFAV